MRIRSLCSLLVACAFALTSVTGASAADRPGVFSSWDDEVYDWSAPSLPGSFAFGGVSLALLIAGDQAARSLAVHHGAVNRPAVLSTLVRVDHIPRGLLADLDGKWVAQSYIYEYLFVAGLQGTLPVWGSLLPTLIAAGSGADLQTVKTVGCFFGGGMLLATALVNISRWQRLYIPQWRAHQVDEAGAAYIVPGLVTMFAGFADAAVAAVLLTWGAAYATGQRAATTEPGLFPMPLASRQRARGLRIVDARPFVSGDGRGGLLAGFSGKF